MNVEHDLYKTGDEDACYSIKDNNGEVVFDVCRVCGGAEGELPTKCLGRKMTVDEATLVYAGKIDFI